MQTEFALLCIVGLNKSAVFVLFLFIVCSFVLSFYVFESLFSMLGSHSCFKFFVVVVLFFVYFIVCF